MLVEARYSLRLISIVGHPVILVTLLITKFFICIAIG